MVAVLIWLKLLPCTFIPQKQYTGLGKYTFYPRMRFLKFPLGFASCPKGYFWAKKREKPFFFFDTSKEKGLRNNGQSLIGGVRGVCVCCVLSHSVVSDTLPPHRLVCQAPPSMGLSRQEYWSGLPLPLPRDLPDLGIEPTSPMSLALAGRFFTIPMMKCCYPYVYPKSLASPFIDFVWLTLTSLEDLVKFNHILSTSPVSVESFISGSL